MNDERIEEAALACIASMFVRAVPILGGEYGRAVLPFPDLVRGFRVESELGPSIPALDHEVTSRGVVFLTRRFGDVEPFEGNQVAHNRVRSWMCSAHTGRIMPDNILAVVLFRHPCLKPPQ